jgi:hypothetical protein
MRVFRRKSDCKKMAEFRNEDQEIFLNAVQDDYNDMRRAFLKNVDELAEEKSDQLAKAHCKIRELETELLKSNSLRDVLLNQHPI